MRVLEEAAGGCLGRASPTRVSLGKSHSLIGSPGDKKKNIVSVIFFFKSDTFQIV